MKSFLIIGGYSGKNPGDEAILKATLYRLNSLFPGARFSIWTDREDFTITFDRPINVKIIFWRFSPKWEDNNIFVKIARKLYLVFFPLSRYVSALIIKNAEFTKAINQASDIALVGGGYLTSLYSIGNMNYLVWLAKKCNKPVYLLGQTIGPFTIRKHKAMMREIAQISQKIVVRDSGSLEELKDFPEKVILSTDDAISFAPRNKEIRNQALRDYLDRTSSVSTFSIGLNLRLWEDSRRTYPELAAAFLDLVRSFPLHRLQFIFISMESSEQCDDVIEVEELQKFLDPLINMIVIKEPVTVEDKRAIIAHCDFFIGMRLHSLVFSLSNAVPSLGLYYGEYYRQKIIGLFEGFGVQEFALHLSETHQLYPQVLRLIEHSSELQKKLRQKTDALVARQEEIVKTLFTKDGSDGS